MKKCIFVPGKRCYIRGRSVPLEVCRTCIEAYRAFGDAGRDGEKTIGWVGVALLRRKLSGVKVARVVPEEARVFNGLERAVFSFLCSLRSLADAHVEINGVKVMGIARRGGEVAVLMADGDGDLERLGDGIERAAEIFKSERDWIKALEGAYREISLSMPP